MKRSANKKVSESMLREFILITLAHAEKRDLSAEQVAKRLRATFQCCAIVIAREVHQEDGGFHFHVALKNTSASKNNATRIIRELYQEFEGSQCNVKFHKGWGVMVGYVTKEDKEPYVWGQYSRKEVMEMGEAARKKKKGSKDTKMIMEHIQNCNQWLDMYQSEEITERLIYGSYSSIRSVYEDLTILKQTKKTPIQRIEEYLRERESQGAEVEEYAPEDIGEKYILLDWLACNLMFKRPIKTKQLHIYGPPSTQKTLMFEALKRVLRVYFASSRINDFAGADDLFDLWVYDEFHLLDSDNLEGANAQAAQAYSNILLKVLDGQECRLDAKYSRIFTKTKNIPIIVIANKVTPRAVEYGPFQERFLRVKFVTNIEDLKEERIIATLMGCMRRRAEQMGQKEIRGDRELAYNFEKVMWMKGLEHSDLKDLNRVNRREWMAEGRSIAVEYLNDPACKTYYSGTYYNANFLKIMMGPTNVESKKLTALDFAIIPLKKREGTKEDQERVLSVFNSKRRGANFRIIRKEDKGEQDYMAWPIRVVQRNKKKMMPAEIYWEEGEAQVEEVEMVEMSKEEKDEQRVKSLNDHVLITLGTVGWRVPWDEDTWRTED